MVARGGEGKEMMLPHCLCDTLLVAQVVGALP
jgi:hypothetical protein